MNFNKEETKNLLNMLRSPDKDNHVLAFETLKNVNVKNYTGELIVMYKYSGHALKYWQENCLKAYKELIKYVPDFTLTSPKTLSLIKENKGSNASVEVFMEYFIKDMTKMLESIGYPTDSFEVNIKLKENGQEQKSK
jgi:hypothetical protein